MPAQPATGRSPESLQTREARLSAEEAALFERERAAQARLSAAAAACADASRRLGAFRQRAAHSPALRAVEGLALPSGAAAEASRRAALDAREAALRAREAALAEEERERARLESAAGEAIRRLAAAEHELEQALARARAEEERRKAEQQARAAATPTPQPIPLHRAVPPPAPPRPGAGPERRQAARRRLVTEVSLHSDSNFFTGFSQDVSEGGVFVATHDPVAIGTPVDVELDLPGGKLKTTGTVTWTRELNDLTPDVWPGIGIRFDALPPPALTAIQRFVAEREPLFFET